MDQDRHSGGMLVTGRRCQPPRRNLSVQRVISGIGPGVGADLDSNGSEITRTGPCHSLRSHQSGYWWKLKTCYSQSRLERRFATKLTKTSIGLAVRQQL